MNTTPESTLRIGNILEINVTPRRMSVLILPADFVAVVIYTIFRVFTYLLTSLSFNHFAVTPLMALLLLLACFYIQACFRACAYGCRRCLYLCIFALSMCEHFVYAINSNDLFDS